MAARLLKVPSVKERVLDGLDVETFFLCRDEAEAKSLMLSLLREMGFEDVDVVFVQQEGPGARVRGRAYLRRPGARAGLPSYAVPTGAGAGEAACETTPVEVGAR